MKKCDNIHFCKWIFASLKGSVTINICGISDWFDLFVRSVCFEFGNIHDSLFASTVCVISLWILMSVFRWLVDQSVCQNIPKIQSNDILQQALFLSISLSPLSPALVHLTVLSLTDSLTNVTLRMSRHRKPILCYASIDRSELGALISFSLLSNYSNEKKNKKNKEMSTSRTQGT